MREVPGVGIGRGNVAYDAIPGRSGAEVGGGGGGGGGAGGDGEGERGGGAGALAPLLLHHDEFVLNSKHTFWFRMITLFVLSIRIRREGGRK